MSGYKILVLVAITFSASCAHIESNPVLRLPTLGKAPEGMDTVRLTGRLDGYLQYDNSCFRLKGADSEIISTILWGESFEAIKVAGSVAVRDKNNNKIYYSGMRVMTGGGHLQNLPTSVINSDVAINCGGPFVSVHSMEELK